MSRFFLFLCTVCVSASLFALTEEVKKEHVDRIFWSYYVSNDGAVIAGSSSQSANPTFVRGAIEVPSKLGGYPVTGIGKGAFKECSGLTSIQIPETVTMIDDHAFNGCSRLTTVKIPAGLQAIGTGTFTGCKRLKLTVDAQNPNYVSQGGALFTKDMTRLICHPGAKGAYAVPKGVTAISDSAFRNCVDLTSVTISEGVAEIGIAAFYGCQNLKICVANQNATYLSQDGALFTKDMTRLICHPGARGGYTVPDGVKVIGDEAFFGCAALTSIVIPESVTSIGSRAFSRLGNLALIDFQGEPPTVGEEAFPATQGRCSGKYAAVWAAAVTNGMWQGLTVQQEATEVSCFTYFIDNNEAIITGLQEDSPAAIVIPVAIDGFPVTSIGDSAFEDCAELTSVIIPKGITSIGDYAFYGCSQLTEVVLPESVTSIGDSAFYGCAGLTSVVLPKGMTSLEEYLFFNCSALEHITIPAGVTSIGALAFYGCSKLTAATIPTGVTEIGDYAFDNCSGLTSVQIPEGMTSIGMFAFYGCTNLASVKLPDSVTVIGDSAFAEKTEVRVVVRSTVKRNL